MHLHCEQCHNVCSVPQLSAGKRAVCPRCGHTLLTVRKNATERVLAFSLSALVFLGLSLPFNFLTFRASGQHHSIDLPSGLGVLISQDYLSLAIITGVATLLLPGIVLSCFVTMSWHFIANTRPRYLVKVSKTINLLLPWSMAEIFLVGTLVSLIKITELADVSVGLSFYAFIGFTIFTTLAVYYYDPNTYKTWLFSARARSPKHISRVDASKSIQRTWALLVTSIVLYIPANMLPIMHTELMGGDSPNTIIGGVISLWESGSYPVASIIFLASVVVPVAKIGILLWLNYSVHFALDINTQKRMAYYRFIEAIGRWSMIDVFVVAVLVALIQMGSTMSIYPGPAALAFCAVVFVTMVAAMTFDSRLIWHNWKGLS